MHNCLTIEILSKMAGDSCALKDFLTEHVGDKDKQNIDAMVSQFFLDDPALRRDFIAATDCPDDETLNATASCLSFLAGLASGFVIHDAPSPDDIAKLFSVQNGLDVKKLKTQLDKMIGHFPAVLKAQSEEIRDSVANAFEYGGMLTNGILLMSEEKRQILYEGADDQEYRNFCDLQMSVLMMLGLKAKEFRESHS